MKVIAITCGLALFAVPAIAAPTDDATSFRYLATELADQSQSQDAQDTLGDQSQNQASQSSNQSQMDRVRRVCKKMNLTDEQKETLKETFKAHKEATAADRDALKKAKKDFIQLVLNEQAVATEATPIVTAGVNARTALAQARGDLATKVMFEILNQEQRKPALACLKAIRNAHRRHHH